MAYILKHDLLNSSHLFDVGPLPRCTKPDKSQLISELEKNLEISEYSFHPVSNMKIDVILDFLS